MIALLRNENQNFFRVMKKIRILVFDFLIYIQIKNITKLKKDYLI